MAKRSDSKAAKIRALAASKPGITAREVIDTLAKQKVKVTAPHVYAILANGSKPKRGRPAKAGNKYASLVQAKRLADAMGGVEKARAVLDVLARLV